jgi:hypothetical protein
MHAGALDRDNVLRLSGQCAVNAFLGQSLFSRLPLDVSWQPKERDAFLQSLSELSIPWVGCSREGDASPDRSVAGDRESLSATRIHPIGIDQDIDVEQFQHVGAIELQLYGRPFQTPCRSERSHWCSNLPVEIFQLEQLTKKIELIRFLAQSSVAVGAAIGPLQVYEDVRFLADCGVDYVCILGTVFHRWDPAGELTLCPPESYFDSALKAARDSGTSVRVRIASDLTSPAEMHRCLREGVHAVCVDAYLAARCQSQKKSENLGSFLGYAAPQPSPSSWIRAELAQLVAELDDWNAFYHRG